MKKNKKTHSLILTTAIVVILMACNDSNNETSASKGEKDKTNVSDSRRYSTDTANYTVDSTAGGATKQ